MEFKLLYEELTNSTEMIRALLSGLSQEDARVKPNRRVMVNSRSDLSSLR